MSYADSEVSLHVFSSCRPTLEKYLDQLRDTLETVGGEYEGPATPPKLPNSEVKSFLRHLADPDSDDTKAAEDFPGWIFTIASSEENVDAIVDIAKSNDPLFVRIIRVFGDQAIRSALNTEHPPEVKVVAELGKRTHGKGAGYDPYTYDPNRDHKTDL